jgi:hypothetical protein
MDVEPRDTCGASTALKVETTSHAAGNASRLLATDTPDEGRELQCLLHDAGLRVSRARVAVLLALATTPQATAVIVAARARRESGGVSMQAVYGVLTALAAAGLVQRVEPVESPTRFELHASVQTRIVSFSDKTAALTQ